LANIAKIEHNESSTRSKGKSQHSTTKPIPKKRKRRNKKKIIDFTKPDNSLNPQEHPLSVSEKLENSINSSLQATSP
jgi:hypothetical protein